MMHLLDSSQTIAADLCSESRGGDPVQRFFYLFTAANALYFSHHFATPPAASTKYRELRAFKRWARSLDVGDLRRALREGAVEAMLDRIPFDDRQSRRYPDHSGEVINYRWTKSHHDPKFTRLDEDAILAGRRDDAPGRAVLDATSNLAKFIYTVRCNLFHGQKELPHEANEELLDQCSCVLEIWVEAGLR